MKMTMTASLTGMTYENDSLFDGKSLFFFLYKFIHSSHYLKSSKATRPFGS